MEQEKTVKNYTRTDTGKNKVLLEITIPADIFSTSYKAVLQNTTKDQNLPGFRKGQVPTSLLEPRIQEPVLMETFERIAPMYVSQAIVEEKLEPIAPPMYTELPKLLLDMPVKFKIEVTLMPVFKLGNLKKIKIATEDSKVKAEELDKAIEQMFQNQNNDAKGKEPDDKWAVEVAKTYAIDNVKGLADLKTELEKLLQKEKERIIRTNAENDALLQAINLCEIEIPIEAINYETSEREHSFEHNLSHSKMSISDFCKKNSTTIEELRELWNKDSKEALETDAFLKLYADNRKVEISQEELEEQVKKIKAGQKEKVDDAAFEDLKWRESVMSVMRKQKAYTAFIEEVLPKAK